MTRPRCEDPHRLVVLAVAAAFVPLSPDAVERWYSTSLYLRLQAIVTPLTNLSR